MHKKILVLATLIAGTLAFGAYCLRPKPLEVHLGEDAAEVRSRMGPPTAIVSAPNILGTPAAGFVYYSRSLGKDVRANELPPLQGEGWLYQNGFGNTAALLIYFDKAGHVVDFYYGGT